MLDAAAGLGDLIRRHGGVADEDHFVISTVFMQQILGGETLGSTA
jgi:hypothetical protein